MAKFSVSERLACRGLGQHRSTHRKKPGGRKDDEALTADIVRLASRYGRYGYRRITELVSHYLFRDRFERPGKGNDKGKVEGLVKYARSHFMTPIPMAARS